MSFGGALNEDDDISTNRAAVSEGRMQRGQETRHHEMTILWPHVVLAVTIHLFALYGAKLFITDAKPLTIVWSCLLHVLSVWGLAIGAHRLWSHRSFKAKLPLRIFLTFCNTIGFQFPIFYWAKIHRFDAHVGLHHKFPETDADHANVKRGFFFAHVGWLLCKQHPDVKRLGYSIDMSDLLSDPCVSFQKKHFLKLGIALCFVMPTVVPILWGESLFTAFFTAAVCRFVFTLQIQFCLSSIAHYVGDRPYDGAISAAQTSLLNLLTLGEGQHNFHHVFPWDYKASEYSYYLTNLNTAFIDAMAALGAAYDLKTTSAAAMKARVLRSGDGSHHVWGWRHQDAVAEERVELNKLACEAH